MDANLLLYACLRGSVEHAPARAWFEGRLNGSHRVGLPWASLTAFLRIATHPRIFERPLSIADAWSQVSQWLELPNVWIPEPTESHREILGGLLSSPSVRGNLVPDAHLAALALGHGLLLCTTDGDFARFAKLRWRNPLLGTP